MRRGSNRRATANQQPANQTARAKQDPDQQDPAEEAPAGKAPLGSGYGEGWLRRLVANCWKHKSLTLVAFGASLIATLVTTAIPLIQRVHHRRRDPHAQASDLARRDPADRHGR